jgi:alpha-L-rhamnosidase
MKRTSILLLTLALAGLTATSQVTLQHLLTENLKDPIGIDARQPRFSWQLVSTARNIVQRSYEIKVFTSPNGKSPVWNSGTITSEQSVQVPYGGPPL